MVLGHLLCWVSILFILFLPITSLRNTYPNCWKNLFRTKSDALGHRTVTPRTCRVCQWRCFWHFLLRLHDLPRSKKMCLEGHPSPDKPGSINTKNHSVQEDIGAFLQLQTFGTFRLIKLKEASNVDFCSSIGQSGTRNFVHTQSS